MQQTAHAWVTRNATTTRSYRRARSVGETLAEMHKCRQWWRTDVYGAFLRSVGAAANGGDAPVL